jgi:hypothetical protein
MMRSWLPHALVILTALLASGTARDGAFIYDDQYYVLDNPAVSGEASPWTTPLGSPDQALWRPLTVASFRAQWDGSGDAGPFRVLNLLLHAAVSVLVLLLARSLKIGPAGSLAAALLFAAHPVHAEAVAWVTGRAELLAAGFVIASWLAWLRSGPLATATSIACFALAMLSKENAVVAPLLFLCADRWLLRRAVPRARLVGLAMVVVAVIAARQAILPNTLPQEAPFGDLSFGARAVVATNILGRALGLMLWPDPLRVFHPRAEFLELAPFTLAGLFLALFAVLVLWRSVRPAAVALLLVPVSMITVLNLVPIGATFAERFLYLPSMLICLALGAALTALGRVEQRARRGAGIAVLLPALALVAALPVARSGMAVFRDDLSLWAHASRVAPAVAHARYNHGYYLNAAGQDLAADRTHPGARDELAASLAIDPGHLYAGFAHQILGNIALGLTGNRLPLPAEAARHYREAIAVMPNLPDARINLASIAVNAPGLVGRDEALAVLAPFGDASTLSEEQRAAVGALRAQLLNSSGKVPASSSSTGTSSPDGS